GNPILPIASVAHPTPAGGGREAIGAADRRAAEWVISVGGQVVVHTPDDEQETYGPKALPSGVLLIERVLLRDCQGVTDAGLANLTGLTELRIIDLAGTPITGTGLAHLAASADYLVSINLDSAPITDEGAVNIARFPALNTLNMR